MKTLYEAELRRLPTPLWRSDEWALTEDADDSLETL